MCIILYILIFLKGVQQCFFPVAAFMSLTCSSSFPTMLFVLLLCNFFFRYKNINIFHTYLMASVTRAHVTQIFRPFKRQPLSKRRAPFFTHQKNSQKHTESDIFFLPSFLRLGLCVFCACSHARVRTGNQLPACWIS